MHRCCSCSGLAWQNTPTLLRGLLLLLCPPSLGQVPVDVCVWSLGSFRLKGVPELMKVVTVVPADLERRVTLLAGIRQVGEGSGNGAAVCLGTTPPKAMKGQHNESVPGGRAPERVHQAHIVSTNLVVFLCPPPNHRAKLAVSSDT
jgi:hypothetical protein